MRLKLKNGTDIYYSNVFQGSINKSQLELSSMSTVDKKGQKLNNQNSLDLIFLNKLRVLFNSLFYGNPHPNYQSFNYNLASFSIKRD